MEKRGACESGLPAASSAGSHRRIPQLGPLILNDRGLQRKGSLLSWMQTKVEFRVSRTHWEQAKDKNKTHRSAFATLTILAGPSLGIHSRSENERRRRLTKQTDEYTSHGALRRHLYPNSTVFYPE